MYDKGNHIAGNILWISPMLVMSRDSQGAIPMLVPSTVVAMKACNYEPPE